jgi:hypothetical protein
MYINYLMCWMLYGPNVLKLLTKQELGRPVLHSYQLMYVAPELYHCRIPAGSSRERTSRLSPSESKKSERLWDFHQIAHSIGCVEMTSSSAASHLLGELCSDRTVLCCIGGCFNLIKWGVQREMAYAGVKTMYIFCWYARTAIHILF